MKILWVKAGKILPVDTGGKIRSYNLLRELARNHEVTLLSYYDGARDEVYETEIESRLPGAHCINTGKSEVSIAARALDYLQHLPSNAPYAVTKFTTAAVKRTVREWLDAGRFDVAVCDFLSASLNFPAKEIKTPCVLFQHNVESQLWQRQAAHPPNVATGAIFKLEAAKMKRYETATVKRFDHIIAVSEADKELMTGMTCAERITVVPTGVDTTVYRRSHQAASADSETPPLVLFLGSMDWEPNIDGVEFFCREIWERVQRDVPNARFRIVGRNPHPRVRRLASASVEVTGGVESVVEHLHAAHLFVVPLRIGGGTRLKIFEAMAAGKAIVSTSIGAEGLDVEHNRNIILADTPTEFAEGMIGLLRDATRRREMEESATELAARYDWSIIAQDFEAVLQRTIADKQWASAAELTGDDKLKEAAVEAGK